MAMDDASRLTSVVFRLSRDRLERLKALSKQTRIRQSEYLREAISDVLEKHAERPHDEGGWPQFRPPCNG